MDYQSSSRTYRCPGQQYPISQAVHLARLAAFYPACRQCPHREDTGTLSTRQIEQLQELRAASEPRSLFHDEGAGGVYLNDLTPAIARAIAAAFGMTMRGGGRGTGDEGVNNLPSPFGRGAGGEDNRGEPMPALTLSLSQRERGLVANPQSPIPNPSILLAGDGRAITAELTAAVSEGLRFSGCDVIDIGPATAACLAFAIGHLRADGGVLVGNAGHKAHIVSMQFWNAEPQPLSAGGSLERIADWFRIGVDRPARKFGALSRAAADVPYLAAMSEHYHALRPLRMVVDSASRPLVEYLQRLAATVVCEVIPSRVTQLELPDQIRADAAHFAACVDGDGETCRVLDEKGRTVPTDQLLLLLAAAVIASDKEKRCTIVLEDAISPTPIEQLGQRGMHVVTSGARRAEMAAAMRQHGAVFGGGPSGRFWYAESGVPLPDALMTITRLLVLLSRSDEPLSAVLDRDAAPE